MAFGLVGGLVAAGDMKAKQEALAKAYAKQGVMVSAHLVAQVEKKLLSMGYQTRIEDARWKVNEVGDRKLDLDKVESRSDAVLFVGTRVIGFVAPKPFADYVPSIWAVAEIYGADRAQPMYTGFHAYGWRPVSNHEWRWTEAPVSFADFDKLIQDSKASSEALMIAAETIAAGVAADMAR